MKSIQRKHRKLNSEREKIRKRLNEIITTGDLLKKFVRSFLHSFASYILSFLMIYIIYQGVTILVARLFKIPVIWYYYQLKFPLYYYSILYTRKALIFIFSSGPMISLVLTLIFLKLFFSKNGFLKNFNLFYLWGIINGLNMFFGAYIVGVLTRTEFVYTSEWLLLNNPFDIWELIFIAISLVIMFLAGWHITSMFLISSGSKTLVDTKYRLFFILSTVILPWIACTILFFLIMTPRYYIPFLLKTLTPGLILIPSLFSYKSAYNDTRLAMGMIKRNYFRWGVVIGAFVLLLFYRIVLNFGVKLN